MGLWSVRKAESNLMNRKVKILSLIVLGCLVLPAFSQSQEPDRKPGAGKGEAQQAQAKDRQGKTGNPGARLNILTGLTDQLNLDDDQVAEIRQITREFAERIREQQGNSGDSEAAARRQELLAKFKGEGLKGPELRKAVQQALGPTAKPAPGSRPRDLLAQRQAELISKVREVLTEEQQERLDGLLRKRAEEQQQGKQRRESGEGGKPSEAPAGKKRGGDGDSSKAPAGKGKKGKGGEGGT